MLLSDFKFLDVILPENASKIEIKSITSDSRKISPKCMFVAIKGSKKDGHDFINDAISKGASNVLVDYNYTNSKKISLSKTKNVRKSLAFIAAAFYNLQPNIIAAVTGTNGKTSVCSFLQQLWQLNKFKSASLGTLGLNSNPSISCFQSTDNSLTTLDPINLHKCISQLKLNGINRLALEASSHGLDQFRLDGAKISLACFTNLSHDHLDYHKSLTNYKNQKFRLFKELLQDGGSAIINIDDPFGNELFNEIKKRNLNIITYGKSNTANWRITKILDIEGHKTFNLSIKDEEFTIPTALNSNFQIFNSVAASGLAYASGVPLEHSLNSIKNLVSPKGRMQEIISSDGVKVFIDFCHTPEALENILKEKSNIKGRLFLIIGCGGDRDTQKRKIIGKIASKYSYISFITDDNPRNEDPKKIRKEIIKGNIKNNLIEIDDRKKAIEKALNQAKANDVIIIAGKGHESFQNYKGNLIPHNDFLFCKSYLLKKGKL